MHEEHDSLSESKLCFTMPRENTVQIAPDRTEDQRRTKRKKVGLAIRAYEAIPPLVPGERAEKDMNLRNQFAEFCSIDRSPGSLAGWR